MAGYAWAPDTGILHVSGNSAIHADLLDLKVIVWGKLEVAYTILAKCRIKVMCHIYH